MWQLCIPIKPSGAGICHCPPGLRDCHGSRICDWGSHRNLLLFNPTGSAHTVLQVSHWTRGISYKCDLQVFLFKYWHLWWKAQDFCEGETTNTSRHKHTVTGAFWRELIMEYQLWSPNANVRGKAGERTATHLILPHFKTILLLGTLIFLLCSTINTLKPLDRCTVIVEKKSNCLEIKSHHKRSNQDPETSYEKLWQDRASFEANNMGQFIFTPSTSKQQCLLSGLIYSLLSQRLSPWKPLCFKTYAQTFFALHLNIHSQLLCRGTKQLQWKTCKIKYTGD